MGSDWMQLANFWSNEKEKISQDKFGNFLLDMMKIQQSDYNPTPEETQELYKAYGIKNPAYIQVAAEIFKQFKEQRLKEKERAEEQQYGASPATPGLVEQYGLPPGSTMLNVKRRREYGGEPLKQKEPGTKWLETIGEDGKKTWKSVPDVSGATIPGYTEPPKPKERIVNLYNTETNEGVEDVVVGSKEYEDLLGAGYKRGKPRDWEVKPSADEKLYNLAISQEPALKEQFPNIYAFVKALKSGDELAKSISLAAQAAGADPSTWNVKNKDAFEKSFNTRLETIMKAFGTTPQTPQTSQTGRQPARYGTFQGRKVVEYSNGDVEYAD